MADEPPVQILDGGLGTSLEDAYGVKFDASMPLWSSHFLVTDPALLIACQRDFGEAGVDILLTPTYQVSIDGFAKTTTPEYPEGIPKAAIGQYLRRAIHVATEAKVHDSTKMALSLGPYGATMIPGQEYSGKYDEAHDSEEGLYQWHLERLRLFTDIDGLLDNTSFVTFETIPRLDEIRAVRRAVRAAGLSGKRAWVSCVFPGEGNCLPDGGESNLVVDALMEQAEDQAELWGIGINCTKIEKLPLLVEKFETAIAHQGSKSGMRRIPALVLYPDGTDGEEYNTNTQTWVKARDTAANDIESVPWEVQLAAVVKAAQERGQFTSFVVGGCCKASHHHIQRLREQVRA